jgi:hypothetical protein
VLGGLLDTSRLTNLISEGWAWLAQVTAPAMDDDRHRPGGAWSEPAPGAAERLDAARDRLKASVAALPQDESTPPGWVDEH